MEILLEEYNPIWPIRFEREADRIRNALGDRAQQVHHVGSTSVPHLCAKPVIDVLLVVADSSDEPAFVPDLEAIGYALHIREPDWFQHRMLKSPNGDINLHVFTENVSEISRMLAFRDWLRSHDHDRRKYELTKRELSKQTWLYVQQYADAKTVVIEEILDKVKNEIQRR